MVVVAPEQRGHQVDPEVPTCSPIFFVNPSTKPWRQAEQLQRLFLLLCHTRISFEGNSLWKYGMIDSSN